MEKILIWILTATLAFGVSNANAQTECFTYDDEEETIEKEGLIIKVIPVWKWLL